MAQKPNKRILSADQWGTQSHRILHNKNSIFYRNKDFTPPRSRNREEVLSYQQVTSKCNQLDRIQFCFGYTIICKLNNISNESMGQDILIHKTEVHSNKKYQQKRGPTVRDQNVSYILLLRFMVSSMRNPRDCSSVPNSEIREGWILVASMPLKTKIMTTCKKSCRMHIQLSKLGSNSYAATDEIPVSKLKQGPTRMRSNNKSMRKFEHEN